MNRCVRQRAVRDLVEAAMLTGRRAGELTKAHCSAFDERTRTFTVTTGKTGRRSIPLSPDALALFRRLSKDKLPDAPLFTRDDSKPWAHSDWDKLVRDAARKADLPKGVCLYTLRHTFITQTLMAGLSTLEVSKMVGTSLTMIEKHYGHLVTDTARERLAKSVVSSEILFIPRGGWVLLKCHKTKGSLRSVMFRFRALRRL